MGVNYYLQVLKTTWHSWGHTARSWIENEGKGDRMITGLEFCLNCGLGWGFRVSWAYSLLVKLKHKAEI